MPRLRNLSGRDLLRIFQHLGFTVVRVKGSHHILRRVVDGKVQTINIPVHGMQDLPPGLLKRLYRDASRYIPEEDLAQYFMRD